MINEKGGNGMKGMKGLNVALFREGLQQNLKKLMCMQEGMDLIKAATHPGTYLQTPGNLR
ncbi:hypothetical protein [Bhargavaea beijingensis]|uniref:hypothetical protein n=1 Tax=Bhargavaea beijingensis TaxID=426756 RepID=UPI00163ACF6D|nr:hypothetical protein [Bhargavaea beijingensis]